MNNPQCNRGNINLSNTLEPPTEGAWNNPPAQEYYNVSATMNLNSGEQILRFSVIDDPHFYIDRFTFELVTSSQEMAMQDEEMIHTSQDRLNGAFTIQLSDPQNVKLLNLYGITGNLCKSIPALRITTVFPAGTIPGGVIILQTITGQRKYVKKVVVL